MQRNLKIGLITFLVALVLMAAETFFYHGFSMHKMCAVLWKSMTIGVIVGLAVHFMDKRD